jgi:MFS family permease
MSLLIVSDPRDRGLHADGVDSDARPAARRPQGMTVQQAVRSAEFKSLYAACLICSFAVFVPFVHLVPFAQDHGIEQTRAALLIAMIGAGSTFGRFFLGGVADRIGRTAFLVVTYIGMTVAMAIWIVAESFAALALFAVVLGLFYGGWVAVLPAVVMDRFGGVNLSAIIGVLYTSVAVGTLIGPSVAGFLFDMTHSYRSAIIASVLANLVAAAIAARALVIK